MQKNESRFADPALLDVDSCALRVDDQIRHCRSYSLLIAADDRASQPAGSQPLTILRARARSLRFALMRGSGKNEGSDACRGDGSGAEIDCESEPPRRPVTNILRLTLERLAFSIH